MYLRHRQIAECHRHARQSNRWFLRSSTFFLWVGYTAAFGLSMVANFQVSSFFKINFNEMRIFFFFFFRRPIGSALTYSELFWHSQSGWSIVGHKRSSVIWWSRSCTDDGSRTYGCRWYWLHQLASYWVSNFLLYYILSYQLIIFLFSVFGFGFYPTGVVPQRSHTVNKTELAGICDGPRFIQPGEPVRDFFILSFF